MSDNDELFVSNRNDIKAVHCCMQEVRNDIVEDAKEINDTTRTLDLSYEVVTKLEHQEVDP